MRACIVGGGLAGSLLAWRLARAAEDWDIELVLGDRRRPDATSASGGAVRAYEADPEQRRLATAGMVELLASRTLRRWAEFHPVESVYLRRDAAGLADAAADIELLLPGSAELAGPAELERRGWAGVHAGATAVRERLAGYLSPARLRDAVLGEDAVRRRVSVLEGPLGALTPREDGTLHCEVAGRGRDHDLVVLAVGPWTPAVLRAGGLPAAGYRTKSIQYAVHPVGDWRPPQFVDEVTGLFGRPTADGGLLLGLPTEQWEVAPDRPPVTPALRDSAGRLARARFPALRLGPAGAQVGGCDCYAGQPGLSLRRVVDTHALFTFTGGAGGAAKTALAASHRAAVQLVAPASPAVAPSAARREGHR